MRIAKRLLHVDFYQNRILERYSSKDPKPITLRQLTMFGRTATLSLEKLLRSGTGPDAYGAANYVREELPVRLAHRIRMFQQLPFVVGANPHVEAVYLLYWEAFEKFRAFPAITTLEENKTYCQLVESMLKSHRTVIPKLMLGIHESQKYMEGSDLNKFVSETLQSRVSRRVLAEQHIALSSVFNGGPTQDNLIGIVNTACNAHAIVSKCANLVGELFVDAYEVPPPDVIIDGNLSATFAYIPDHIEYIIFELLKNSMKYTFLTHQDSLLLPPIRVTIGVGDNQVMFRVSDQSNSDASNRSLGGGIDRKILPNIWNFVKPDSKDIVHQSEIVAKVQELVPLDISMGIGLPMSKVYAKYWGGNVSLFSMDRFGVDAYVTITTGNSQEQLEFKDEDPGL
ncbi:hypothetical protein HDV03_000182 [Kappamyces sp. JEL0829]|nr:hypothetical protein HDV03_000182 [Kappamyces sp. JEL0829]